MKSKILIARKISRLVYSYMLFLFYTTFALYILRQGEFKGMDYLILAAVMIISWILRDKTGSNLLLLVTHLAVMAVTIYIETGIAKRIVLGTAVFIIMVNAMKYNRSGGKLYKADEIPWPFFIAGMVMYAFGLYMNNKEMLLKAYLIPVFLFITYLIVLYLDGVYDYLDRTKDIADLPVKRMVSVNSVIVAGIIAVTVFSIIIAYIFKLDILMRSFFRGLLAIVRIAVLGIRFVYTLILSALSGGSVREKFSAESRRVEEIAEKNSFADNLTTIIVIGLIILAAVIIYYLVRRMVRFILARRRMPHDTVEEIREKIHDQKEKKKHLGEVIRERLSTSERCRRIYKRAVLKAGKPYIPDASATTGDITELIKETAGYDMREITELYNEIRYSNMTPDIRTVAEMKKRSGRIDV